MPRSSFKLLSVKQVNRHPEEKRHVLASENVTSSLRGEEGNYADEAQGHELVLQSMKHRLECHSRVWCVRCSFASSNATAAKAFQPTSSINKNFFNVLDYFARLYVPRPETRNTESPRSSRLGSQSPATAFVMASLN